VRVRFLERFGGPKSTAAVDNAILSNRRLLSHYVLDVSLRPDWSDVNNRYAGHGELRFLRKCASGAWAVSRICGALFESGAVVGSARSREGATAASVRGWGGQARKLVEDGSIHTRWHWHWHPERGYAFNRRFTVSRVRTQGRPERGEAGWFRVENEGKQQLKG